MPPSQTPHRTPLRRISQGSLFRFSRSNAYPDAPHGLAFLEPAMSEFLDETESLQSNLAGLDNLSNSLAMFNESFASWLYIMNMNALTTDWPQAPTEASYYIAKQRAEQDAIAAIEALKAKTAAAIKEREMGDKTTTDVDTTAGNVTVSGAGGGKSGLTSATTTTKQGAQGQGQVKKKGVKPKLTAKEKKERSMEIEKIVSCLPLEFRGSDPSLRRNMETVIEALMYSDSPGLKITDFIHPPELNQARANKCLIALVNRKVVVKENSTGTLLYHWKGIS